MNIREQLDSPEQTRNLGRRLAKEWQKSPGLILLSGDLGAGKTTFAQGFINALTSDQRITSPTYSYLNMYQAELPIFHFDLYRISSAAELEELGLWEHLLDSQALRLVEWPEHALGLEQYADVRLVLDISTTKRQAQLTYFKSF